MACVGLPGVVPVTGHKQVDLPALYRQVGLHGGYELVSEKKWWRNIGAPLFYISFPASTHHANAVLCMLFCRVIWLHVSPNTITVGSICEG